MTTKRKVTQAVTNEQLNEAIARWCGWRIARGKGKQRGIKWTGPNGEGCNGGGLYGWGFNAEAYASALPNYFGDLRACAEAANHLRLTDRWAYAQYAKALDQRVAVANGNEEHGIYPCDAPARLRALALHEAITATTAL